VSFSTPEGVDATPELLRRLVDSPVVVSATVGVLPNTQPPPAIAARLGQVMANVHWLAQNGATVVAGTDAGIAPGKPHGVLPWAVENLAPAVGLVGALRMLTSVGAAALGLGGRKGVLARGADADLLAVRGNPLTDGAALREVLGVWTSGRRLVG
jgi:imidazolonepropionase-like amidohydrolase